MKSSEKIPELAVTFSLQVAEPNRAGLRLEILEMIDRLGNLRREGILGARIRP